MRSTTLSAEKNETACVRCRVIEEIEWISVSVILSPTHCLDEHSLIERCCHLSGTSIAVTLLNLFEPTYNAMHCVVSNKFDPIYIVCMKFHATLFLLPPPVLASSCQPNQNFSKEASLLNQKIDFRFTSQVAMTTPWGEVMSKMPFVRN